ncbi:MAG: TIGR03435 family protein [Acidobacteriota bacterium]|nr:TIGR03435 family protein [Acidobacteriota bacterium]
MRIAAMPAVCFCAATLAAQPAFDVVSVKPEPWAGTGSVGVQVRGDTLRAEHCTLYDLAAYAWNVRDDRVSGGPAWATHGKLAESDLYQVIAKVDADPPPPESQFRIMLRGVLEDRFRLKVRDADRDAPVYYLVVAKGGPKLKAGTPEEKSWVFVDSRIEGGKSTRITATRATLEQVIHHFEYSAGRPIFDKTGLTGFYDFEITWSSQALTADGAENSHGTTIFSALESQLGLKLEAAKAPLPVIMIEHAEKPSLN